MKFYKEEAWRILAGQKNLSTVVMSARVGISKPSGAKNVDSKADSWEPLRSKDSEAQRFVEKLRTGVDISSRV